MRQHLPNSSADVPRDSHPAIHRQASPWRPISCCTGPNPAKICCIFVTVRTKSKWRSSPAANMSGVIRPLRRPDEFAGSDRRLPRFQGDGIAKKYKIYRGNPPVDHLALPRSCMAGFHDVSVRYAYDRALPDETCGMPWKNLRLLWINERCKCLLKKSRSFRSSTWG